MRRAAPHVLISILSALHEAEFAPDEVQSTLAVLFDKQYIILTTEEIVEVRYRTETRTGSYTDTDPETGETSTEYYTYEVEVPYNYYIMNVTLENFNLSHVPVYIMSQDQLSMYAAYIYAHLDYNSKISSADAMLNGLGLAAQ